MATQSAAGTALRFPRLVGETFQLLLVRCVLVGCVVAPVRWVGRHYREPFRAGTFFGSTDLTYLSRVTDGPHKGS